jgi:polysaccharide export outer membrane protein
MQKTLIHFLFAFLLAFELTSCVTTHETNYLQAPKNFIPAYKDSVSYQDYRLKEGDKLYIQVYSTDPKTNALFNGAVGIGMQVMSTTGSNESLDLYTYNVQTDGNILFPIVGAVQVKGKTLREAKKILEEAIKPLLKINSVDVRMVGRSFSIIGAGNSGRFSFPREKINIFQAIAMAGDVGFYTDRSKIKILRQTPNGPLIKVFDIRSVNIINSDYYYLEPDDIIFLQPMKAQFFGVATFWSALSTVVTTISFGAGIYALFFPKN